jgi:hypothetical protein
MKQSGLQENDSTAREPGATAYVHRAVLPDGPGGATRRGRRSHLSATLCSYDTRLKCTLDTNFVGFFSGPFIRYCTRRWTK